MDINSPAERSIRGNEYGFLFPRNAAPIRRLGLENIEALQRLCAIADADGAFGRPEDRERALTDEYIYGLIHLPF